MKRLRVLHLVDDTTPGGVMRVVDYMMSCGAFSDIAVQSVVIVKREGAFIGRFAADVIISHLSVSWRNLPRLTALRWQNPKARLIHVEHSYTECFVSLNVPSRARFAALLRLAFARFDTLIAVSRAQAEWIVSSGYASADKVEIIQSCVDLSVFRSLPRSAGEKTIIGAIGRLERQKGFDTIIAAVRLSKLAGLELRIYGTGSEEKALKKLSGGDPRIRFMGFAPDPVAAMAEVDVVAMPSKWEAYGLVAIEALAAGRKLVVHEIDGLRDHLPLGATGIASSNPQVWCDVIDTLVEKAGSITQKSWDFRLEDRFCDAWTSVLRSCLSNLSEVQKHPSFCS